MEKKNGIHYPNKTRRNIIYNKYRTYIISYNIYYAYDRINIKTIDCLNDDKYAD